MTMVRFAVAVAAVAALSLTGCSETRRALGYDKAPPDEFAVVAHAPLSQPPDFTLRPPMPGAPRPQEGTTRDQAKGLLVGGSSPALASSNAAARSQGEQLILTKSGAEQAEPDIRRKVNEETTALIEADNSFTDKILFWRDKPQPGEPLNANDEAKRLQNKASTGQSTNQSTSQSDTPQITRGSKGWLGGLF